MHIINLTIYKYIPQFTIFAYSQFYCTCEGRLYRSVCVDIPILLAIYTQKVKDQLYLLFTFIQYIFKYRRNIPAITHIYSGIQYYIWMSKFNLEIYLVYCIQLFYISEHTKQPNIGDTHIVMVMALYHLKGNIVNILAEPSLTQSNLT